MQQIIKVLLNLPTIIKKIYGYRYKYMESLKASIDSILKLINHVRIVDTNITTSAMLCDRLLRILEISLEKFGDQASDLVKTGLDIVEFIHDKQQTLSLFKITTEKKITTFKPFGSDGRTKTKNDINKKPSFIEKALQIIIRLRSPETILKYHQVMAEAREGIKRTAQILEKVRQDKFKPTISMTSNSTTTTTTTNSTTTTNTTTITNQTATKPATTNQPITKQPITKQPITPQATTKKTTTKQPFTMQPITKQPITKQPITKQPITKQPTTKQPITTQYTTKKTTTKQTIAKQPIIMQPTTKQPITMQTSIKQTTSKQLIAKRPITKPIISKPTTKTMTKRTTPKQQ